MGLTLIKPSDGNGGGGGGSTSLSFYDSFDPTFATYMSQALPTDWDGSQWVYQTKGGQEWTTLPINVTLANATDVDIEGVVHVIFSTRWSNFHPVSTSMGLFGTGAWIASVEDLDDLTPETAIALPFPNLTTVTWTNARAGEFTVETVLQGKVTVPPGGLDIYIHPFGKAEFEVSMSGAPSVTLLNPHVTFIGG